MNAIFLFILPLVSLFSHNERISLLNAFSSVKKSTTLLSRREMIPVTWENKANLCWNESLRTGQRLIGVRPWQALTLNVLAISMEKITSGGKESDILHNRMILSSLVKIMPNELQNSMSASHDLILSASCTTSSADFRRSSDETPRWVTFISVVLDDCGLIDDGVLPNSNHPDYFNLTIRWPIFITYSYVLCGSCRVHVIWECLQP